MTVRKVGPPKAALVLSMIATIFAAGFSALLIVLGYKTNTPSGASGYSGFIGAGTAAVLLLFPLWTALATVGVWRRIPLLFTLCALAYLAQSLYLGFSFGGPNLVVGVPLLAAAAIAYFVNSRRGRQKPSTVLGTME